VAAHALVQEHRLAFFGECPFGGRLVRGLLVGDPCGEVFLRERDGFHAHVGVREPAELRALTGVDTRFVCLESQRVDAAWHGVTLAVQRGNPIRVDDVAARLAQEHLGAGRHHELSGRDDRLRDAPFVLHGVVVFPPPLLASHVDDELGVVGARQVEDHAEGECADDREDERGDHRERDLERGLAVRLLRDWLAAVFVTPHRIHDGDKNDDADDAGDGKNRLLQIVDLLGIRALGLPGVLRSVRRARREEGDEPDCAADAPCKTAPGDYSFDQSAHALHAKARAASGLGRALVIHGTTTSIDWPSRPGTLNMNGSSCAIEGLL